MAALLLLLIVMIASPEACKSTGPGVSSSSAASAVGTMSYFTYTISNRLLHEITKDSQSHPDESIVRGWLQQLQAAIETCSALIYSTRLAEMLISRANFLQWKVKSQKGSIPKHKLLSKMWELRVLDTEHTTVAVCTCQDNKENQALVMTKNTSHRKRTLNHYSQRHERRIKRQRADECVKALSWLQDEGLTPVQIVVQNEQTEAFVTITLDRDLEKVLHLRERISPPDQELVMMMLYIKDKHNISGNAYHEMASICKQMPRSYRLKQKIAELNSKWNLFPTPAGTIGVQQSLKDRLKTCVQYLIESAPKDAPILLDNIIRVKLTGDGTNLGKHLHVVNFAFTIILLEEGDKAYGLSGNHCIGIFKEEESYDAMKNCLIDIVQKVQELRTLTVCDRVFSIQFYLGGDWKFLAMVTGIDSATSKYACIWCKCPALELHDSAQQWSITDPELGARSIEENVSIARSRSRFNVSNEPIFPMIPLTRVVVNNLHMFLRVADTLIDLLLLELRRLDNIDRSLKVKSLDALHYIKLYESTLKMNGISGFSFWIGRDSKKPKCRTLTGPEKLLLFKRLKIAETFPQVPYSSEVERLWQEFLSINSLLSIRPSNVTDSIVDDFEKNQKHLSVNSSRFTQANMLLPICTA